MDVGSDQAEDPSGLEKGAGFGHRLLRPGRMFDDIDHGHGLEGAEAVRDVGEEPVDDGQSVAVRGPADGPGAWLDSGRRPAAVAGQGEKDAGGRADVEQASLGRAELLERAQDPQEVPGPAFGLLVIGGILDLAVERGDEIGGRGGIGEDVAASAAPGKVPDLPVLAVRDLDLLRVERQVVERLFLPGRDVSASADGAGALRNERRGIGERASFWAL